jgi:hypothetical protein
LVGIPFYFNCATRLGLIVAIAPGRSGMARCAVFSLVVFLIV